MTKQTLQPVKKSVKRKETEDSEIPKGKKHNYQLLKEMDYVEIEHQEHFSENSDDEEEEDGEELASISDVN